MYYQHSNFICQQHMAFMPRQRSDAYTFQKTHYIHESLNIKGGFDYDKQSEFRNS